MGLRPYQLKCLSNIRARREAGVRRQLISQATGTGKTVCFANLPEDMPKGAQMHMIAHRMELIEQGAEKIAHWNPTLNIGVEMAERKADGREDVIVSCIDTLRNRVDKYDPANCCWLVIDEAHHSTATSYGKVIDHFMVNPHATLLGFTATPNRADGVAMGSVFDEIVFSYGMRDAIEDGWLSDVHGFQLKTNTDISRVGTKTGDFNEQQLSSAVNTVARNEAIVKGWIDYCWPRQTVVFTVDVKHAKDMCSAFQRQGIKAAAIWGNDPDRRTKLAAFRKGELAVLLNCQILIEGFDMWQVECVVPAAPTKSQARLIQEVGRGTRLQEDILNLVEWREKGLLKDTDKTNCLVMDPIDILGRHSLATLPSLFGLSPNLDLQGQSVVAAVKAIQAAQRAHPEADMSTLSKLSDLQTHIQKIDLWKVKFAEEVAGFSEMQWTRRGDGTYRILLPGNEYFKIEEDIVGKFVVTGRLKGRQYDKQTHANLEEAVSAVEVKITAVDDKMLKLLRREARWHKNPVTDAQKGLLRKLRVPEESIRQMNSGDAAKFISSRINRNRD
jgi:ATP-dependent helicase IRC3